MQAKKLLPFDQKLMDAIPGKAKKMFNARNENDVQGPYQKSSGKIPGALNPHFLAPSLLAQFDTWVASEWLGFAIDCCQVHLTKPPVVA